MEQEMPPNLLRRDACMHCQGTSAKHIEKAHMSYAHMWVNHSTNFVNPLNGAHTQSIEGVWEVRVKQYLKAMRGVQTDDLQSYLDQFLWRSWYFPENATGSM
ncbi:hypothetical protein AC1031_002253 [Aphanomyces cochlioides]|nr:hypothetical protein AC1031_002253 [Aphanomyces cochlioides]